MSGIFLEAETLAKLSSSTRTEIGRVLGVLVGADVKLEEAQNPEETEAGHEQLADLTSSQVRRFLTGVSEKTLAAMREIAASGPNFLMSKLMVATGSKVDEEGNILDEEYAKFRGLRSGLTKRTRTVLGDRKAELISYRDEYNGDEYVETYCHVSQTTYHSLKTHFGY